MQSLPPLIDVLDNSKCSNIDQENPDRFGPFPYHKLVLQGKTNYHTQGRQILIKHHHKEKAYFNLTIDSAFVINLWCQHESMYINRATMRQKPKCKRHQPDIRRILEFGRCATLNFGKSHILGIEHELGYCLWVTFFCQSQSLMIQMLEAEAWPNQS